MHEASESVPSGWQHECGTAVQLVHDCSVTVPGGHSQTPPTQSGSFCCPDPQAVTQLNAKIPPQSPPSIGSGTGAPASNDPPQPLTTVTFEPDVFSRSWQSEGQSSTSVTSPFKR